MFADSAPVSHYRPRVFGAMTPSPEGTLRIIVEAEVHPIPPWAQETVGDDEMHDAQGNLYSNISRRL